MNVGGRWRSFAVNNKHALGESAMADVGVGLGGPFAVDSEPLFGVGGSTLPLLAGRRNLGIGIVVVVASESSGLALARGCHLDFTLTTGSRVPLVGCMLPRGRCISLVGVVGEINGRVEGSTCPQTGSIAWQRE